MSAVASWFRRALLAAALVLPLAAAAQQITVSAAASLTDALRLIGRQFEADHPGTMVRFNFAASGVLLQQIVQGAPADVFASADQATMDRAAERQLITAATRRDFAANSVVLIVPAAVGGAAPGAGGTLRGMADLGSPAVRRIAIGKPETVPVGRYTKQALEAAGVWTKLAPKYVQADSVRQVLDYVARGEVEAGFVYGSDAALLPGKVKVAFVADGHTPVTYPVAVVADSRNPVLAKAFVDTLGTPAAQAVFARFGFAQP